MPWSPLIIFWHIVRVFQAGPPRWKRCPIYRKVQIEHCWVCLRCDSPSRSCCFVAPSTDSPDFTVCCLSWSQAQIVVDTCLRSLYASRTDQGSALVGTCPMWCPNKCSAWSTRSWCCRLWNPCGCARTIQPNRQFMLTLRKFRWACYELFYQSKAISPLAPSVALQPVQPWSWSLWVRHTHPESAVSR